VTTITTITPATCKPKIGQIQKIAFQRQDQTFVSLGTIELEATWTALLASLGNTRIQITPFIHGAKITAGDEIVVGGGDNTTVDAVALLTGAGPSAFEGMFRWEDQLVVQEIREYQCESIQVYFFNKAGQIVCALNADGTKYNGFPIEALFIGDMSNEGYADTDKNVIKFQLKSEWANRLKIVPASDFNPLELINA